MDRSASNQAGVCEHLPGAAITFDEFHVMQLVNKAVDEVRRQEVKRDPELQRTRYIRLKDQHAWSHRQKAQFAELKSQNLKTHRAFRIKETLREIFHNARSAAQAGPLLDAFDSRLINGHVEAVNSLIQAAKAKPRGYGTTRHLITIVYLVAGKLTQLPTSPFVSSRGFPSL